MSETCLSVNLVILSYFENFMEFKTNRKFVLGNN